MTRSLILVVFLAVFKNILFSQNGPGGVGTVGVGTSLKLWLKADRGLTLNGLNEVTAWQDQSGNANALTIVGVPVAGVIFNGYPSIQLDGTNSFVSSIPANTGNLAHVFFAGNITGMASTPGSPDAGIISGSSAGFEDNNSIERALFLGAFNATSYLISHRNAITAGITGGAFVAPAVVLLSSHFDGAVNNMSKNGVFTIGATATTGNFNYNQIYIGRRGTAAGGTDGSAVTGNYAEIIHYSGAINNAQRLIIDNYLQAKYNGTLTNGNIYTQDNPGNGNYDHDVAGIGRISAAIMHTDAQGSGIVRINNASSLDNNDFLMWGHDGAVQSAINTADVPASIAARFQRVWRVSEVSVSGLPIDVGAIDVSWDLTGLGPVVPSQLRLLVDTDNDGVFNDEVGISGATLVSGNVYRFTAVTAIQNTFRFTLATTNVAQTPLPIELTDFTANVTENQKVDLNWVTASETDNASFTIQRSANGIDWELIGIIEGAGYSSTLLRYHFEDVKPLNGISYYRIRQTDFNGEMKDSKIVSVEIGDENDLIIYPNPTRDQLIIFGSSINKEYSLSVFNSMGQNVQSKIETNELEKGVMQLNVSILPSDIYFINVNGVVKQFVKE